MNEEDLRFVMASAISYKMMHDKLAKLAPQQTEKQQDEAEEFYIHFGYTLSLEIIDKINLAQTIGATHMEKLKAIIAGEKDYNIFALLILPNHQGDMEFRNAQDTKDTIDRKYTNLEMRN